MTPPRLSFSDRTIVGLPLAVSGQHIVRDQGSLAFSLLVGTRSKAFWLKAIFGRTGSAEPSGIKIGDVGQVPTREARQGRNLLGSIADGIDPRPKSPAAESPAK